MTQSLSQYLAERGLLFPISDFMLDKLRLPHGLTARQRKRLERDAQEHAEQYQRLRTAAIADYKECVKSGQITPPTPKETLLIKALGHPDNTSVQAARRVCDKRGIDWREYAEEEIAQYTFT